jgi:hypothetical protein
MLLKILITLVVISAMVVVGYDSWFRGYFGSDD